MDSIMHQFAIHLEHLNVKLGSKQILFDLSVEMPPCAIGLLGPNGAGKSTLLKTLMGFITPFGGSIRVFGMEPRVEGPAVRQVIGYMPEEDTYIAGMSAVEFVTYCGLLCGLPPREAKLRAHQSLHYCGLGEARYRKIDTYSTGMRQRIKLAQALVHDPKLLFLDEPTNGLDPQGRKDMLELIKDVSHNKGISVILSSHLLPDVEEVCDSVMVLFKGKLAKTGKINDLKKLAQT
ncbi:ATP-binding cassette domain-containing protein, partial [bacterium]|nr:ATP-binding cassette domain-containing protein [bacterium]